MKRREFIHAVSANLAWLGLGALSRGPLLALTAKKDVTAKAHVGHIFPPLELVHRLRDNEHSEMEFLELSESPGFESAGARAARTIYVGLRVPGVGRGLYHGNLTARVRDAAMRSAVEVLQQRFHYRVVRYAIDEKPGFWYPYANSDAGNLLFCRLDVRHVGIGESV